MRVDETICLAALMQALVAKIYKLMRQNLNFRPYRKVLINENKWRAARDGIQGKLIDFGKQEEVPYVNLAHEMLDFVDDVVDELGSRHEVQLHRERDGGGGKVSFEFVAVRRCGLKFRVDNNYELQTSSYFAP